MVITLSNKAHSARLLIKMTLIRFNGNTWLASIWPKDKVLRTLVDTPDFPDINGAPGNGEFRG
jgi:hypothetical protein